MGTIDKPKLDGQADSAKAAWHRFVETFEPLRPELYRYCRALTHNAWDAEDLVQDALARGLVTLGCLFQEIENPRAWMFRVASNLWIDRQRRKREETTAEGPPEVAVPPVDHVQTRDSGRTLIGSLSPQERAAVLLKDVFEFTLEETAAVLGTTTGAIKPRCTAVVESWPSATPSSARECLLPFWMPFATRSTRAISNAWSI
jgi:RNA polymerase sigma-70 factor, ECF subfamily